ncbi:protein NETWORKED 4A-like [Macadamia integrifolia]|uniref:protein NETWORKED 4A-like n=1 Tax=Macadamia integrifolia TaxID=60698 RepID=UPI001C5290B2|nr:protein NETWORKED 4A-like [Macadamia integrifolia]XP_042476492.1 protein NETWORKED 4A-like [Macadamia integrifolia]XP_042476493.1 protein NETWORKED 4A-like [Macadamia integrifolia]
MSQDLKRLESTKSHSWWWDSHICPKSSKWMAETLEDMDKSVKRMLKLIEGDGDSFAKKADMYYQKRPELISHVEDFYRMYRSLAERYNHLTGELRKNIPHELQSQSSSFSDAGSGPMSPIRTPRRSTRQRNGHRAPGFDFFLGSLGGSFNDLTQKNVEAASSPSSDSELDSDETSSMNNYSGPSVTGDGESMHRRVIELEIELRDAEERLREAEEGNKDGSNSKNTDNGRNHKKLLSRIAGYEEQLRISNGKLKLAEGEIARLKLGLGNDESTKLSNNFQAQLELAQKDIQMVETENKSGERFSFDLSEASSSALDSGSLIEILKTTNRRLRDTEDEIAGLKIELENKRSSEEDITDDATSEMPEVVLEKTPEQELLERITGLEEDVMSRDNDIKELEQKLKKAQESLEVSEKEIARLVRESHEASSNIQVQLQAAQEDLAMREIALGSERTQVSELREQIEKYKFDVSDGDNKLKELKGELSHTTQNFSAEKERLQAEFSAEKEKNEKLQAEISKLTEERAQLESKLRDWESRGLSLQEEIEQLKASIAQRGNDVETLNKDHDALKLRYDMMVVEKDGLKAKVETLMAEVSCRDDKIQKMEEHLNRLHMEQVELMKGAERGRKVVKELEEEVERQRVAISNGAEEKREAIRQLCFSLDHYRDGYKQLRQAFIGHNKRHRPVLAS